jgi:hypothetical protein
LIALLPEQSGSNSAWGHGFDGCGRRAGEVISAIEKPRRIM